MATFESDAVVRDIEEACAAFDRKRAGELVAQLAGEIRGRGEPFSPTTANRILKRLLGVRFFEPALELADAFFESGGDDLLVTTAYAQALIDSGRVAAALALLEPLAARATPRSHASNQLRGLLGRAYKQLYVNGGGEPALRADYLLRALNAYYDVYLTDPRLTWQGVNAAALLARGARDGVQLPVTAPIAEKVYEQLRDGGGDAWASATAGEAALALGRYDEANRWYAAFAAHPDVDAFAIASALRQLVEVWRLDDREPPGSDILPLLRSELLRRQGGNVALPPAAVSREMQYAEQTHLEKTFGSEGAKHFKWYRTGLERCMPVCRIGTQFDDPRGTGFVVRGGDFHPKLGDERMILTNDHVVSKTFKKALPPKRAFLRFHALDNGVQYTAEEIVWGSTELDASLLRITPEPPEVTLFPIAEEKIERNAKARIFVIGHPMGGALSISLYDNHFVDCDDTLLHYRSPTEPGSSGSPVFNDQWELIALHHAGRANMPKLNNETGTYEANEGIWIQKIREACGKAEV